MMPYTATFLIAMVLSWFLWHKLRDIRFVADLDRMSGDLFDIARLLGRLEDPAYIQARQAIEAAATHREFLSLPIILRATVQDNVMTPRIKSTHAEFDQELAGFCERLGLRVLQYALIESLFGLIISVLAFLWPIGDAKEKSKRAAQAAVWSLDSVQTA